MDSTERPPGIKPSDPPGPPADICSHFSSKIPLLLPVANNNPAFVPGSKKWFVHKIENEKTDFAGDLTGDLAGDLTAKKMCYCSKIDFAGDIAGDIVAKSLYYCSKTTKLL